MTKRAIDKKALLKKYSAESIRTNPHIYSKRGMDQLLEAVLELPLEEETSEEKAKKKPEYEIRYELTF